MSGLEVERLEAARGVFRLGPLDLTVPEGTATALLGRSGAGKTTLLRTLAGFLPSRGGRVRLGGTPLDELPPERREFGFVPPNLGLFPHRRVRENVAYPLRLRGVRDATAQTAAWIHRFELDDLQDRFPSELSSGQRQRVAMARALASSPRALLWDEPLAALDVESRDVLLRLVRRLIVADRLPLLLVTHDPTTALALADRIVVLDGGTVRFEGPPEALSRAPLDRFLARFLGFENLLTRAEIDAGAASPLAPALRAAAGPGGVVLPPTALRYRPSEPGTGTARVTALRWSPGGWSLVVEEGPWTFHLPAGPDTPGLRVGDAVTLSLDAGQVKPLSDLGGEGAA